MIEGVYKMGDYIWYVIIASTSIYLIVRLFIHLLEFSMFLKIKEALLKELYNLLSNFDDNYDMDLSEILKSLYKKVDSIKGRKYVDKIDLRYGDSNNIILTLIMDNGNSKPRFDFNVKLGDIINIEELK